MLSQALPGELVENSSYMPARAKSAYVRLVDKANDSIKYQFNKQEESDEEEEPCTCKCKSSRDKFQKNKYLSQSLYFPKQGQEGEDNRDNLNSSSMFASSNQRCAPSAHELVAAKNTAERLKELERTNLNLKRMLQFVSNDPSRSIDRLKSAVPKLLVHRTNINNTLGPPQLRQGRIGSNWRHIKQTNNYSNSNLLFIDGTVRINDSAKFPPHLYGYPPKTIDYDEDLIGLHSRSLVDTDLPIDQRVRNRQADINARNNQFHERARQGFEYWLKDSREPDNNKKKAPAIAIGHPYFKSGF